MRKVVEYAAALVLLGAGVAAFFFAHEAWAVLLWFLGAVVPRLTLHFLMRILVLALLAVSPERGRRQMERLDREFIGAFKRDTAAFVALWRHSPEWLRIVLTLFGMAAALALALVALVFPIDVASLPYGTLLQEEVVPRLLRTSAAGSVRACMPRAWKRLPKGMRKPVDDAYIKLWFAIARPLVHTHQALTSYAVRRARKARGEVT